MVLLHSNIIARMLIEKGNGNDKHLVDFTLIFTEIQKKIQLPRTQ